MLLLLILQRAQMLSLHYLLWLDVMAMMWYENLSIAHKTQNKFVFAECAENVSIVKYLHFVVLQI
jgi:hypothetical protein